MYSSFTPVELGPHEDLYRQGRYRVELKAELAYSLYDVDTALEEMGYEVIDAGQWGRSYRHRQDHRRTVELDEPDEASDRLRLVLEQADLAETEIGHAEGELDLEYARLQSACSRRMAEADYDLLATPAEYR